MTDSKPVNSKDTRKKVEEIRIGSVVIELFEKIDPKTNKVFFDYRTCRAFPISDDEESRGPYCQQRDLRDNIKACVDAMTWISDQHRAIRAEYGEN